VTLIQAVCDAAVPHGIMVVVERHLGSFADTPERISAVISPHRSAERRPDYQVLDFLPAAAVAHQAADARQLVPAALISI